MDYRDVLEEVQSTGRDAEEILREKLPKVAARFERLDKAIAKLLADVQKEFPDATYYTSGGDGFALLLGPSHDEHSRPLQDLAACHGLHARIDGGDW